MVFRSFPKLHQNGSVPHQISPPNSHFLIKKKKPKKKTHGASCPGYYLTFLNPTIGEALPTDTLSNSGQSLPTKKLAFFLPCGRRVSPIQAASFHLRSGDGERLPATQLYLSVFTCPTPSLNLPSDAGESLPARQPYLFHPTADLPFRLYLSDTASIDLPSDAGESLPARQLYLFEPVAQRGLPVRQGDLETSRTPARASTARQSYLPCLMLGEAYPPD